MNDDMDFDNYDEGLDTEVEETTPRNEGQSTADTTDLVAQLLRDADSVSDEDIAAHKERNPRGYGDTSRSVDSLTGRADYSESAAAESAPKQSEQPQTLRAQEVTAQKAQAASEWEAAHKEAQLLREAFESGQISAEDHYRLSYEQGVRANKAQQAMMMTRISELEYEQQKAFVLSQLSDLGDDFAPERIEDTFKSIVEHASSKGISPHTLAGVENKDEVSFLYNSMQNEKKLQAAEMELKAARAMLKKQNAQLKGRRLKQGKDAQTGTRNRDTVEQVADLLAKSGITSRGRR